MVPLFYFAMHSAAGFIQYSNDTDATFGKNDLMEAWSNYFFGVIAIHTMLAQRVWNLSCITWEDTIAFRLTALEVTSCILIFLFILIALALLAGVLPFDVQYMPYFFVVMVTAPPIILGCLYLMCRRLLV